jgi:3-oxoacyl-[acyl-carrier protein] reductase
MGKLTGKVALVTGASKGIGAAIAESLGAAGAAVAVNYATDKTGAERVVEKINQAGGKAIAVQGSVAKNEDVVRIFAETEKALGKVSVLVNNAGVYKFAPIEAFSDEDFDWMFNTNVRGLLRTTQEAVKHFGETGGVIINTGSVVSHIHPAYSSIYTSTKGAVDSITGVLARELGPRGIRVNSINPGLVLTEGIKTIGMNEGEFYEKLKADTPLGRIGVPEDYGAVAVFLASDDSHWITGEALKVSGGNR